MNLPLPPAKIFCIGIGGIGVSGLAQLLVHQGYSVAGSDRGLNDHGKEHLYDGLRAQGIRLYPQDGSGPKAEQPDALVISTAVEDTNADLQVLPNCPVIHRATALAQALDRIGVPQIAVAGSCGKTSVTGWIAAALKALGKRIVMVDGGYSLNAEQPGFPGNFFADDKPEYIVVEVDESDRSLSAFHPHYGVLLNVGNDHYGQDELKVVFRNFLSQCNQGAAEGVSVTVNPLTPAIQLVHPTLIESFGGVKVHVEGNESRSDLAICILRDPDPSHLGKPLSEMRLTEVTTLFTSSNNISLSRRGIEPVQALFGVYVRDHWGNMSDTTYCVLTPLVEVKLDTVLVFKNANIADDNCPSGNSSNYPVESLWDGSGLSQIPHFFASSETNPSPCWLTIDLGLGQRTASISRVTTLPRIGYVIYGGGAVRDYEFWGSLGHLNEDGTYSKPTGQVVETNEHGFDDTWFCLGKFTQFKPSGYLDDGLPGTVTAEDSQAYNAGNDFELNPEEYPHCNDPLRYFRVVFANTFTTFEFGHNTSNRQVQTGEVTPFGRINETE